MNCRHCHHSLEHTFIDLGHAPPSNAYLRFKDLSAPELYFPLKLKVCTTCWLVQTEDYTRADELFNYEYAYFSSTSSSWCAHAADYVNMITRKLGLCANNFVIEVAANDGYLLKNFVSAGIPCLGIEPTASTADASEKLGIPVIKDFFSLRLAEKLAAEGRMADLILGNNVLAHVPDINDFVAGIKILLAEQGVVTMEFPHLMQLVANNQFDTIYHEHFSYLSFYTVQEIFLKHGLKLYDVEEIPTHGGSLRIYARHADDASKPIKPTVAALLEKEAAAGMKALAYYKGFQHKADQVKYALLDVLLQQKRSGLKVAAYGAAAKGNTLLNYCGIRKDLIRFVVDASPHKQGKFLPGSHIPVVAEDLIQSEQPDYVLILPWNIKDEIIEQLCYIREWGGKFVTAVSELRIW